MLMRLCLQQPVTSHFSRPRGGLQHQAGRLGVGMAACAFEPVPSKLAEDLAGAMGSQVKGHLHPSPVIARMRAALPLGRVAGRSPTGTVIGLIEQEDSCWCWCWSWCWGIPILLKSS